MVRNVLKQICHFKQNRMLHKEPETEQEREGSSQRYIKECQRESERERQSQRFLMALSDSLSSYLWLSLTLFGFLWLSLALSGSLWLSLAHSASLWLSEFAYKVIAWLTRPLLSSYQRFCAT